MFIGGGLMGGGRAPGEEERLFYLGYGRCEIDPLAPAHFRCERIVQDIAAFGEAIFSSTAAGDDREQAFRHLVANFQPGGLLELACGTESSTGAA